MYQSKLPAGGHKAYFPIYCYFLITLQKQSLGGINELDNFFMMKIGGNYTQSAWN